MPVRLPPAPSVTPRLRLAWIVVGMLLAGGLAAALGVGLPPPVVREEMPGGAYRADGLFHPPGNAQAFYDPVTLDDGTTVREVSARSVLLFPYAAHLGQFVTVRVRLASNVPPAALPTTATLRLDDGPALALQLGAAFQVVTATLDTAQPSSLPTLDPAHVQVTLESAPLAVPGEAVKRGVLVDWVELAPGRSPADIGLAALVAALAVGLVLALGLGRLSAGWTLAYGAATLGSCLLVQASYSPRAIPAWVEVGLVGLAWALTVGLAPQTRPAWGVGLAGLGLGLVLAGRVLGDWQLDDAYISYRYAWNLVHGHGLVYNPGEVVEGYTNFLWTVAAAGAAMLGWPLAGTALAANIALSLGLIALVYWLVGQVAGAASIWPLLAASLLALDDSLLTYGARGSGMEAVLLAVLLLAAVLCLWGRDGLGWRALGGGLLAAAALTRPEGLAFAAILLGGRAWADRQAGQPILRPLLAAGLPFALIVGPYEVWRVSFYGYPFPNTFYAKTGLSPALLARGLDHLAWFLSEHWLPATLAGLGALAAGTEWWRRRAAQEAAPAPDRWTGLRPTLTALVLAQMAYIVWAGGDYFPGWRFFVPILAPLVILAVEAARLFAAHPAQRLPRGALAVLGVGAVLLYAGSLVEPQRVILQLTQLHSSYVDRWGSAGLWLRANTPPTTLTAVKGAGAIAYYSQRPVLDALGLNDLHIAHMPTAAMGTGKAGHEKADPPYVLARHPDYILELDTYLQPVQTSWEAAYTREYVRGPTGVLIEWWRRTAPVTGSNP